jgi:hypothetical protein
MSWKSITNFIEKVLPNLLQLRAIASTVLIVIFAGIATALSIIGDSKDNNVCRILGVAIFVVTLWLLIDAYFAQKYLETDEYFAQKYKNIYKDNIEHSRKTASLTNELLKTDVKAKSKTAKESSTEDSIKLSASPKNSNAVIEANSLSDLESEDIN